MTLHNTHCLWFICSCMQKNTSSYMGMQPSSRGLPNHLRFHECKERGQFVLHVRGIGTGREEACVELHGPVPLHYPSPAACQDVPAGKVQEVQENEHRLSMGIFVLMSWCSWEAPTPVNTQTPLAPVPPNPPGHHTGADCYKPVSPCDDAKGKQI